MPKKRPETTLPEPVEKIVGYSLYGPQLEADIVELLPRARYPEFVRKRDTTGLFSITVYWSGPSIIRLELKRLSGRGALDSIQLIPSGDHYLAVEPSRPEEEPNREKD